MTGSSEQTLNDANKPVSGMKNLTPVMRQYLEIKGENDDAILFFRMGDFYEMFFEDAVVASRILGIALTSRDKQRDIPMCGIPYHSAETYIEKLIKDGRSVAMCEQIEGGNQPGGKGAGAGIVERAVTRVITPGTASSDGLVEPKANNFIAAVYLNSGTCGFAYMDVSTGEFRTTEIKGTSELVDEIKRIDPQELLVQAQPEGSSDATWAIDAKELRVSKITPLEKYEFDLKSSVERLTSHYGTLSLDGFGLTEMEYATRAAGALLHYTKDTQRSDLTHVKKCVAYQTDDYLVLDHATRRNLEIMRNLNTGGPEGTLRAVIDRTRTAMGGRLIKSWLIHPLKDAHSINRRAEATGELFGSWEMRSGCQNSLEEILDIERLMVRVTLGRANPRDLVSLKDSLKRVPGLKALLAPAASDLLVSTSTELDDLADAVARVEETLVDTPPLSFKDGGFIRDGASAELDVLRSIKNGGKDWIAALEKGERERTGIGSLKVGYNRVFGYYIEVTKSNLGGVPAEYIRKQTLVNAERYITPELKEWEEKILGAAEKAAALESAIFSDLTNEIAAFSQRAASTARAISVLDVLCSFAEVSKERDYVRPVVTTGETLVIEGGRHPVVEAAMTEAFIANDLSMDAVQAQIHLLTGPNMAGKSTYLRQNALIVLMAQTGCFVPAARAEIPVFDRLFTRVGASDDLSRGHSTFMVEMNETANILNNATTRSLIILDEIGRGTSTFDGLSIAWAVVEHLHDTEGFRPKTLFATHYHELTEMTLTKERVKNYNMAVKEYKEKIIFLRKVVPGGSSRSYGIQVARLAGLPTEVIERAREILANLESGELNETGMPRIALRGRDEQVDPAQANLLGRLAPHNARPVHRANDKVTEELKRIDTNTLTPIEAITALDKLKKILDD